MPNHALIFTTCQPTRQSVRTFPPMNTDQFARAVVVYDNHIDGNYVDTCFLDSCPGGTPINGSAGVEVNGFGHWIGYNNIFGHQREGIGASTISYTEILNNSTQYNGALGPAVAGIGLGTAGATPCSQNVTVSNNTIQNN